jgi:hypothetical protein
MSRADLLTLSVFQIKAQLREKGCLLTGTKAVLIERLLAAQGAVVLAESGQQVPKRARVLQATGVRVILNVQCARSI